jgi:NCAIR mutase (PurE)-related protein
MYISVGYQADKHLEALDFLLNQELFKQKGEPAQQSNVQQSAQLSSEGFQQQLQSKENNQESMVVEIRLDSQREHRKGVPEVILGETKDLGQIVSMTRISLENTGRAIISRIQPEAVESLHELFKTYRMRVRENARAMVIYESDYVHRLTGGHVGVITAGTSDIQVAEEAALVAEEMGCEVTSIYDVGVAGLHRLLEPLRDLLSRDVDAIIVAAGMDGALPSVVAGLVPVPVIGLPTSIGYGIGGKGVAALLSMLQTCAPGLSVVNIDNGVGAGITAAMIANGVARARKNQS